MKVLFITRNYPPTVCGVGDYTYQLAKEFVQNGHDVSVLTGKTVVMQENGIDLHPVIKKWGFRAIPSILRISRTLKPDVIVMQYVPYSFHTRGIPFWLILLYFRLHSRGHKIVTTFHEVAIRYTQHSIKRTLISAAQFNIAQFLCMKSFRVITSIDLYVDYLNRYVETVTKIPVGANILPVPLGPGDIESLKQQIAPNGEFILTSFGTRISDTILYSLAALKKQEAAVKLLILGNIPAASREAFKQKAEELGITADLYVSGYLDSVELYKHLKASSLFVMAEYVSLKGEGGIATKSGSLAAAFAAGIPVLGTKGDTTDAIFRDQENVFLLRHYSVEETTEQILSIMNNPGQRMAVTEKAMETYQNFFSWSSIYERYMEALNLPLLSGKQH